MMIITGALSLGLLPALWLLWKRGHRGILFRWCLFTAVCVFAAVYGMPKLTAMWKGRQVVDGSVSKPVTP